MNLMKSLNLLLLTILSLASLSSCATIMNGPTQPISICSNPTDADVWLDNSYVGNTPMLLNLSRNSEHIVRIELPGYQPQVITFSRKVSKWVIGNLVFGGVIGLAVDAISGGLYVLTPEQVQAEMRCNNFAQCKRLNKTSYIGIVMKVDPSWQKVGNLLVANP